LEGAVEEFAKMLKLQLDLRTEAHSLERFNKNFKGNKHVMFPKLIRRYPATEDVLVETFCKGIPVLEYAKNFRNEKETLRELCFIGIEAVCKMIFLDNFMHGE
jgi:aarF domain-containing kinase